MNLTKGVLALLVSIAGFLCFSTGFHPQANQKPILKKLLLKNATIVDPALKSVFVGHIYIEGDKIHEIYESLPVGLESVELDVRGKWVIPGLHDMHTHSWGNSFPDGQNQLLGADHSAKKMLFAGVMSFLDLFYEETAIFDLRNKQQTQGLDGADIFAAGPIFTCTGGHGTEYGVPTRVVDTPEDAKREVADLAKKKPDVIKLVYDHARKFPSMDQTTMSALINQARELGFKTVVHIGSWKDAEEAITAGATAITHFYEEDVPDRVIRLMRERNVSSIPTMAVHSELLAITQNPDLLNNEMLKRMVPEPFLKTFLDPSKYIKKAQDFLIWQEKGRETYGKILRKFRDSGINLVAGTDSGNFGTFQGFSLHRELEIYVSFGLSEWEALATATVNAGKWFEKAYGISKGDVAHLLVLNESPLKNIRNTQEIHTIIHHGVVVDRERLVQTIR